MTSPERVKVLQVLQGEFYDEATTRGRRVAIATWVRDWSEEELPESRCRFCKHGGVFLPHDEALIEGHCYSENGLRDYQRITQVCEFCFDRMHPEKGSGEAMR